MIQTRGLKNVVIFIRTMLEKYNEIWKKASNVIKNKFDSKPVYNEKYLKTKLKPYDGKINTNFHNNKIPKRRPLMYLFISNID